MAATWKTKKMKQLAAAMISISDEETMLKFLRDLCTTDELTSLQGRWEIVELLQQGKTYRDIAKKTGVSTTTVTRVAQALRHGAGGYSTVIKNLSQK